VQHSENLAEGFALVFLIDPNRSYQGERCFRNLFFFGLLYYFLALISRFLHLLLKRRGFRKRLTGKCCAGMRKQEGEFFGWIGLCSMVFVKNWSESPKAWATHNHDANPSLTKNFEDIACIWKTTMLYW